MDPTPRIIAFTLVLALSLPGPSGPLLAAAESALRPTATRQGAGLEDLTAALTGLEEGMNRRGFLKGTAGLAAHFLDRLWGIRTPLPDISTDKPLRWEVVVKDVLRREDEVIITRNGKPAAVRIIYRPEENSIGLIDIGPRATIYQEGGPRA